MQLILFKTKSHTHVLPIIFAISLLVLTNINLSFAKVPIDSNFLSSIDVTLIKIDTLRTSRPDISQQLLASLEADTDSLSEEQQHYLTYLSGWKSLYQGDYFLGEQKLTSLLTSNASHLIKFRSNYSLINLYALQQRWQTGLQQIAKVLTSSVTIRESKHYQTGLITVIAFYNEMEQYQLALNYSEQLINKPYDKRIACLINQLILLAKLETKRLTLDDNKILNGINLCEKANEPLFTGLIRNYQSRLHLQNNNVDAAINSLLPFIATIEATNYKVLTTLTYNLLAQAYSLKNDKETTKKYALLAHSQGKDLPLSKQLAATYQLLYQIAEQENDFEKALDFHKKFSRANQHYLDNVKAKQLAFQLASHNDYANKNRIEQQQQKINLLNTRHLLTKNKAKNSLLLIMLLLSVLIALALWTYRTWLTQQHLKQLSEVDSLTRLHSREHLILLAKNALKHCQRNKNPLTCIIFDLDNLKKVNDNYGHAKGDEVLKEVTKVCHKIGRQNDILGRIGGEEFAYILPGCSLIIAEDVANRCRLAIENMDYKSIKLNEPITASFGISDCEISGFELDSLLSDANSAMYASKEHGKNCVSIFT